jgi:hypothetical protein
MAVFELARFKVEPDNADALLATRDEMIVAMRSRFPQLIQAKLARLDDRTWIDVWEWQDLTSAKQAAETAPSIPEAAKIFSLIVEVESMEHAEIIHEG